MTAFFILMTSAVAQSSDISAKDILEKSKQARLQIKDIQSKMVVNTNDMNLGMQIRAKEDLIRVHILEPLELADQIIIVNTKEVQVYSPLTNQVIITQHSKNESFELEKYSNPQTIFGLADHAQVKLLETTGKKPNRNFKLAFSLKENKGTVWISEKNWLPYKIDTNDKEGKITITFSDIKLNTGLKAAALKALPKSAEIIRH